MIARCTTNQKYVYVYTETMGGTILGGYAESVYTKSIFNYLVLCDLSRLTHEESTSILRLENALSTSGLSFATRGCGVEPL